jgi:hypothetical protein
VQDVCLKLKRRGFIRQNSAREKEVSSTVSISIFGPNDKHDLDSDNA